MPIYNNKDENKSYASTGVGTTALVLSSVATAAVTGLIGGGNGLGGIFGGNQNPANNATYQLAQKDNEIALLKSQQYTDGKFMALSERLANTESRIIALETAAPLRDQIITNGLANLSEKVNGICTYCVSMIRLTASVESRTCKRLTPQRCNPLRPRQRIPALTGRDFFLHCAFFV